MQDFEGRTAVVTGAASGIGLGLSKHFAAAGMNVVLADVEEDALADAEKLLRDEGHPFREERLAHGTRFAHIERIVYWLPERAATADETAARST
jgi:NAD(P)-dependent dehydrogenase (short-subunit alcohol dehydrogenase family)